MHPASFRDPSGFLFERDGRLYRQVNPSYAASYDLLQSSGLYDRLVTDALLVPHEEVALRVPEYGPAHRVIAPERIPLVSYPYEWCFGAFRQAALLTLRLMRLGLDHGMVLRDASAYNVQFRGAMPVFIDTLSFGPYVDGQPWVAYRQFCQHFLAPLVLHARVDPRLVGLLRVHLDGIPLDLASALLPASSWLRPSLLAHLHLHARSVRRHADTVDATSAERARTATVSRTGLLGLVDNLQSTVEGLSWEPSGTEWADYYAGTNYTEEAHRQKAELVDRAVSELGPATVWDLGANTGKFARSALAHGARVAAFDIDPAAVERGWRTSVAASEQRMSHLVMDLGNPSSGIGWAGEERESLVQRGPADLVLALALVHHLAIGNNVPLPRISRYLARLGRRLVIEFVPKGDSQVDRLLSAREDIFADYHLAGFEAAFGADWHVLRRDPIRGSVRTLFVLERRG